MRKRGRSLATPRGRKPGDRDGLLSHQSSVRTECVAPVRVLERRGSAMGSVSTSCFSGGDTVSTGFNARPVHR